MVSRRDGERRRMRKLTLIVALVVMTIPVFAGVAFAADQLIYCKGVPCYGTGNDDKIYERQGNGLYDKIIMKGGHDLVLANGYGNDTINVADGDTLDRASGGPGGDWCIVDSRKEVGTGCSRVTLR